MPLHVQNNIFTQRFTEVVLIRKKLEIAWLPFGGSIYEEQWYPIQWNTIQVVKNKEKVLHGWYATIHTKCLFKLFAMNHSKTKTKQKAPHTLSLSTWVLYILCTTIKRFCSWLTKLDLINVTCYSWKKH